MNDSKKRNLTYIVGIIILFLVTLGASAFVTNLVINRPSPSPSSTNTPRAETIPSSTNQEVNYGSPDSWTSDRSTHWSFKTPDGWITTACQADIIHIGPSGELTNEDLQKECGFGDYLNLIKISRLIEPAEQTIPTSGVTPAPQAVFDSGAPTRLIVSDVSTIKVDGYTSQKQTETTKVGDATVTTLISVYVSHDSVTDVFTLTEPIHEQAFLDFLSTVSFND